MKKVTGVMILASALAITLGVLLGASGSVLADGQKTYDTFCQACHNTGAANAPKLGDKAAWEPRIATGMDAMILSVTKGKNAMPPKGTCMACSDDELKAAVEYMVSKTQLGLNGPVLAADDEAGPVLAADDEAGPVLAGDDEAGPVLAGDAETGKAKAVACIGCHGEAGISSNPMWPNLAGQQAGYLVKQLTAFRDGTRSDPMMSPLSMPLSDADIDNLAVYYSSL